MDGKKFVNKFRDLRKTFKNLEYDYNIWIYTVNDNGELIRSIARATNNPNNATK
jgi:hypothetical protein